MFHGGLVERGSPVPHRDKVSYGIALSPTFHAAFGRRTFAMIVELFSQITIECQKRPEEANVAHPGNRRKPRLIDRKFQLGLAWRMMFGFLAFFIGGLVIVFAPSLVLLATGSDLAELEPAARELLVLHRRVWPAALFIFGGVFLYTLFFSRRVVGPIFRINSILRRMLEGDYPQKVTFRRGDFFHTTAELLESLSRKVSEEQGKARQGEKDPQGPAAT